MTTLAQVVANIVESSIDHDYVAECGGDLRSVYMSEYGYNGLSPKACKDYLQGLPSACTIPFNNFEVLELLSKAGIERKSEAAKHNLIENYWLTAGQVFYKLIK